MSHTIPLLPASEETLIYFAVHLAKTVKYKTIKLYLAAVRNLHIINGYKFDLKEFSQLHYILRGIKRSQGDQTRIRLPITIQHLNLFHCLLNIASTKQHNSIMIWAAITLAFFGFLRLSELSCNTKFDEEIHLTSKDIKFFPNAITPKYMQVTIKESKTDPFRIGHTLTIATSGSSICSVAAMSSYLLIRTQNNGPIFTYRNGNFLTKSKLTEEIRTLLSLGGIDSSKYAGHSLRIGAATAAAAANIPPWLIKTLGRWSSDCFERYIQTPLSVLTQVPNKLISTL